MLGGPSPFRHGCALKMAAPRQTAHNPSVSRDPMLGTANEGIIGGHIVTWQNSSLGSENM